MSSQSSPPAGPSRRPASETALGRRGGLIGTGTASGSSPALAIPGDLALLLDSRQIAQLLAISRTKVFQLIARGEVPVVRIGRCVRVPRSSLQDWVRDKTSCVPGVAGPAGRE